MSSPRSPYREVGLAGMDVSAVNRAARKKAEPRVYRTSAEKNPIRLGHLFKPRSVARKQRGEAVRETETCFRCKKAKFAVELEPCRGRP